MSPCEKAGAFADGMLPEPEAAEFRMHLADCAACQEEVEAALVLSVLDESAGIGSLSADVERRTPWWRRWFLWLSVPAVATAALAIYAWLGGATAASDEAALARQLDGDLAPSRSIEARFSYPGADRHRPYDVPLADRAPIEDISPELIAALETAEQDFGLVAAYALIGATERAAMTLDAVPESASSLSDRAALEIAEGSYREAVRAAGRALEIDPNHRPATWNRAVALSRLGLPLVAAAAFDELAAAGEPGWAGEARERSRQLRDALRETRERWERAREAVKQLSSGHEPPPAEVIRSHPGMVRIGLYDAARTAASPSELSALVPVARALDEHYGGSVLASFLERLERSRWPVRAPLAARYARVLAARSTAGDTTLIRDAVEAAQPDIALGALFFVPSLDEEQRALYSRLAGESGDPWLEIEARERGLREDVLAGRGLRGIEEGLRTLERCTRARFEFRCLRLEFWVASALALGARAEAARSHAEAGWARARRAGDWTMKLRYLSLFANLAGLEGDGGSGEQLPLMRAYLEEAVERWPGCANATHAAHTIASALVRAGQLSAARRELDELDERCPSDEPTLFRLELDAHLVEGSRVRLDRLQAALSRLRDGASPTHAAYIEGRALVTVDRARALARLREATEEAAREPARFDVEVARSSSYTLAAVTAGRDGDYGAALDWLAAELGLDASRCAIGIAADMGVLVAARDEAGAAVGVVSEAGGRDSPRGELSVPPHLVEHVSGCSLIDVFAKPPFLGTPVLPPHLAWRFRQPRAAASERSEARRYLVVNDVEPPEALGLAALAPSPPSNADVHLRGPAATPGRVLEELATATVVELHAHGVVGAEGRGNAALILSPDERGNFTLTAADISGVSMRGAPVVLLSACRGAVTPAHPRRGRSLAAAFLEAGAAAVVASPEPISDREAYAFFSAIRRRIDAGEPVAQAVRAERAKGNAGDHWTQKVVVFE